MFDIPRTAVIALAAVTLALTGACGGEADTVEAPVMPNATETTARAATPGPDIAGKTLDGTTTSLADYRGRKVIVNVWSSW